MATVSDAQFITPPAETVPLSLPSLLVNPRIRSLQQRSAAAHPPPKQTRRDSEDGGIGKRRRRRFENASLYGNPHAAAPALRDLYPGPQLEGVEPTFPAPPPKAFVSAPGEKGLPPVSDARSEEFGQFNRSLKGIRKALRPLVKGGGRAADVIYAIENELALWLDAHFVLQAPDNAFSPSPRVIYAPSLAEGDSMPPDVPNLTILELSRSPANMLLRIDDPFARFLVHYTARHWGIVSFSKTDAQGARLTYLLRPRMPTAIARATVLTPPTTDLDAAAADNSTAPPSTAPSVSGDDASSEEGWIDLGAAAADAATPRAVPMSRESSGDGEADDEDSLVSSVASLDLASPTLLRRRTRAEDEESRGSTASSRSPSRTRRSKQQVSRRSGRSTPRAAWHPPKQRFLDYLLE